MRLASQQGGVSPHAPQVWPAASAQQIGSFRAFLWALSAQMVMLRVRCRAGTDIQVVPCTWVHFVVVVSETESHSVG